MLTLRRADESDVPAMHALQLRAFQEEARRCDKPDIPPLLEPPSAILEHVRSQVALVARDGGVLVGCVRGIVDGAACTVRALVVEPSHHGQGIGSALLRALEAEVRHVQRIDLTTNSIMQGNVPFYERHGYRVGSWTEPAPGIRLAHMSKPVAGGA